MIYVALESCVVRRMVCSVTLHAQQRTRRKGFASAEKGGGLLL
jgi:hypothetical protein